MKTVRWFLATWIQRAAGNTEWSENWRSWPHCNGQASCWMHINSRRAWCECACRWCHIARKIRNPYSCRHTWERNHPDED